jgi:DNA-binding SARP family transcriptional activator
MAALRVRLFGRLQIRREGADVPGLDGLKARELFCYLLMYRDSSHSREALAEQLWANKDASQTKKYLRQALWQLQSALDGQASAGEAHVLRVDGDWIGLNDRAGLWIDVALFEQGLRSAQGVSGHALNCELAIALTEAVNLYRGDLLEGWYQDWCVFERERLQSMCLAALEKLISYCEAHQDFETGLAYASRILRCDRARERTHRRMMRLHYLSGNRTAALRQYESCVAALAEELGVQPSNSTVALYEQIRADRLVPLSAGGSKATQPTDGTDVVLSQVLDRLKRAQTALVEAQQLVQEDIETVEAAMRAKGG